MATWDGKSKGTPLGYRIFASLMRAGGMYPAYFLLVFVVLYYFLFSWTTTGHSYRFFRNRCRYSIIKSIAMVYASYYHIGMALIDKGAILSGLAKNFSHTSHGADNMKSITQLKRGRILLGAHLGNWEIAGHFIAAYDTVVNIVMYDAEHANIKKYMEEVIGKKRFNIIPIAQDLSHIYLMGEALMRGETICMHGDRFLPGNRTKMIPFMGKEAAFPLGPFQLIKALKAPYTFVYGVKTGSKHYDFYCRPHRESSQFANIDEMMHDYVADLEGMVKKHPEQWFNYYDFWGKDLK